MSNSYHIQMCNYRLYKKSEPFQVQMGNNQISQLRNAGSASADDHLCHLGARVQNRNPNPNLSPNPNHNPNLMLILIANLNPNATV